MASLKNIQPGQTLYRLGNFHGEWWPVKVVEVHKDLGYALCSFNNNPTRKYVAKDLRPLRVNKPKY